jgi:glycosyltransferase involved in cell wall biosynthesis
LQQPGLERVHFLGSRSDIPDLLRGLDLFVLPSINEGISNTILEAMACGVPVVASRVGGNPELVRDGIDGTLFPAGDAAALAACLEMYLGNDEMCRERGRNGRERVLAGFSVAKMVAQYEAVWRRVARAGGKNS